MILTIIIVVEIIKTLNYYPSLLIKINITKKNKMNDDDLLDFYIFNNGTEYLIKHIDEIKIWKNEKINALKNNQKKILRFENRCLKNQYKAFKFIGVRINTRYKQIHYQRYSYKINIISNNFSRSENQISERMLFLSEHDFNVSYNNFVKIDQRKALTAELRAKIKKRDNFTCQICGKYMPDEVGLHIDHIVSIKNGGKSIPSNLRVLCSKCNGKKGGKSESPNLNCNNLDDSIEKNKSEIIPLTISESNNLRVLEEGFDNAFFNMDMGSIENIVNNLLQVEAKNKDDYISLHFLIAHCADILYSLREKNENFETLTIQLCEKDITMYDFLVKYLKGCNILTLTRLAIIYERKNLLKKSIDLCKLGIFYNFADTKGKNFVFRKERLEKKLNKYNAL